MKSGYRLLLLAILIGSISLTGCGSTTSVVNLSDPGLHDASTDRR